MPLDPALVLALAERCAPTVAPSTLLAVARAESGLDPLAIGVNRASAPRPRARSRVEAVSAAAALLRAGHDLDLGLGQINARNLPWLGLSLADAFEPCRNLAAAGRVLADGYRRARPRADGEQAALRTALSFYNTGDARRGLRNGYVARVVAAARLSAPGPTPAEPAPAGPPPAWDVFATARATGLVIRPQPGALP